MTQHPEYSSLQISVEGKLARIQLNRPNKLNALSLTLLTELRTAAAWLNTQADVCVVVVAGNGRVFCAGADLDGFPDLSEPNVRAAADAGRLMAEAIEAINAITIAQIHGWCVGGGLVLAAACDLRLAAQDTQFSIPEVDLGIPLAWGGIPRLVREIGPARTKELVITCRNFSATEALSIGFLNRVVDEPDLHQVVQTLAEQIAEKPRMPVSATKRHTNAVSEQMGATLNAWSDADGLLAGLLDPECQKRREDYVRTIVKQRSD